MIQNIHDGDDDDDDDGDDDIFSHIFLVKTTESRSVSLVTAWIMSVYEDTAHGINGPRVVCIPAS